MDIESIGHGNNTSLLAAWLPWILQINPMVLLIETFRDCILGNPVDWVRWSGSAIMATGLMVVGCSYFRWVEHKFADII